LFVRTGKSFDLFTAQNTKIRIFTSDAIKIECFTFILPWQQGFFDESYDKYTPFLALV
jgi:hypothetical protein